MGMIATRAGTLLDPQQFAEGDFDLDMIAHALAQKPRFSGMLDEQYVVAQHAVMVSRSVEAIAVEQGLADWRKQALWGLHHDDPEAPLWDAVSPLKSYVSVDFTRAEIVIARVVRQCLGLADMHSPLVHVVDTRIRADEVRIFGPESWRGPKFKWGHPLGLTRDDFGGCWDWRTAKRRFLDRHAELVAT